MVMAADGEASEREGDQASRITARSCEAVARPLPVSEFFSTRLGPDRFEIDDVPALYL